MKKEYTLVTFKSTNHAIGAEEIFKAENIVFKTIPTPRVVSHSCGLALLFSLEDLGRVKKILEENKVIIDGLYKFIKDGSNSKTDKIL